MLYSHTRTLAKISSIVFLFVGVGITGRAFGDVIIETPQNDVTKHLQGIQPNTPVFRRPSPLTPDLMIPQGLKKIGEPSLNAKFYEAVIACNQIGKMNVIGDNGSFLLQNTEGTSRDSRVTGNMVYTFYTKQGIYQARLPCKTALCSMPLDPLRFQLPGDPGFPEKSETVIEIKKGKMTSREAKKEDYKLATIPVKFEKLEEKDAVTRAMIAVETVMAADKTVENLKSQIAIIHSSVRSTEEKRTAENNLLIDKDSFYRNSFPKLAACNSPLIWNSVHAFNEEAKNTLQRIDDYYNGKSSK